MIASFVCHLLMGAFFGFEEETLMSWEEDTKASGSYVLIGVFVRWVLLLFLGTLFGGPYYHRRCSVH